MRIPVWIESKSAQADTVFEAKDFTATVGGTPVRVLDVKRPGDGLIVLLVLDLASDLTFAELAKDATLAEVRRLPQTTFVGLLRAQDEFKVLVDPTVDRDAISAAVEAVPVSGKAGLLNSVEMSCRIADSMLLKSPVRVGVLYVTDSDARNYREDFINPVINSSDSHDLSREFPEALMREKTSKLAASLAVRQAPLFIAHVNYRGDRVNEEYQDGLKRLAETTGGLAVFSRSGTEIPGVIQRCFAALLSHYSLTVALPERVPASPQLRLDVNGEGCTLTYRTRFLLRPR